MNICVGNIPYQATEEDLRGLFEAYGKVESVNMPIDRYRDRPRGFGFVSMPDPGEAETAMVALNGLEWMERKLKVCEALPHRDRAQG